jgi:Fur family ferric uptake transcriptional regulator
MSHQSFDYAALLRERGFRVTPQRQLILDAICAAGDHLSPDDVYRRVRATAPAIHRATVYRTLDFLCEMRLIVAMRWRGRTFYEIAGEAPHHHLICRNCDQIARIDHKTMKALLARIERQHDFSIDMDHIVLFGLCSDCRSRSSGSH